MRIISLVLIIFLISCVPSNKIVPVPIITGEGCNWAFPIFVAEGDVLTPETLLQIQNRNETYARMCQPEAEQALIEQLDEVKTIEE